MTISGLLSLTPNAFIVFSLLYNDIETLAWHWRPFVTCFFLNLYITSLVILCFFPLSSTALKSLNVFTLFLKLSTCWYFSFPSKYSPSEMTCEPYAYFLIPYVIHIISQSFPDPPQFPSSHFPGRMGQYAMFGKTGVWSQINLTWNTHSPFLAM